MPSSSRRRSKPAAAGRALGRSRRRDHGGRTSGTRAPTSRPRPSPPAFAATIAGNKGVPCCAARRCATRGCSRCSTRSSTTCRRRWTCPRSPWWTKKGEHGHPPPRSPTDPFLGARVQGRLTTPTAGRWCSSGSTPAPSNSKRRMLNATRDRKEKVQRLLQIHANKTTEVDEVSVGDIVAAVGLKFTATGDTLILAKDKERVVLGGMQIPEPVIFRAIEPKTAADQKDLDEALERFEREDPSFKVREDKDSGQTLICGPGRAPPRDPDRPPAARAQSRQPGSASLRSPTARPSERPRPTNWSTTARSAASASTRALCSSCRRPSEARATASSPSFRPTTRRQAPAARPSLSAVEEAVGDSVHPRARCSATRSKTLQSRWYRRVDSRERLIGGSFRACAAMAFSEALEKATPRLLEPVMRVEVVTPSDFTGNVHSDLERTARSGDRHGTGPGGSANAQMVLALVPLAQMVGYATALRSATQGRASYTMRFSHNARGRADLQGERRSHASEATDDRLTSDPQNPQSNTSVFNTPFGSPRLPTQRCRPKTVPTTKVLRRCPKRSSSATSPTSTSARSVTSTTARPR